eukprot:6563094-Karenia_brevis.AAC.1
MEYAVGNMISLKREDRGAVTAIERWSTPVRVIGHEDPSNIRCTCEGVPVLVERKKCMPASSGQVIAYLYMHKHHPDVDITKALPEEQMSFLDQRIK